ICGTFDPWLGHCLVGLTKNPVESSADIYQNIKESVMVEPQNGQFVGYMNDTKLVKIFDDGMPPDTLHYLDFVITDDDLNIFYPYGETVAWVGYHDFLEISESLKEGVEK
ncbi:hypothetical protein HYT92_01270, partial [Candidatus Pacearchaeota archaeon]|nr:hypothetical protein [Candidatus Pacearchaeota archaeon]